MGKVFSLSQKFSKPKNVLERAAKERGITFEDLLAENGMEVVRKLRERGYSRAIPIEKAVLEKEKYLNKTKYDEILMKELVEDYDCFGLRNLFRCV